MKREDYKYTGEAISLHKLTAEELLQEFAHRVEDYDKVSDEFISLKNEELEFDCDHPNRDSWSDEEEQNHNELLEEISNKEIVKDDRWCRVREVMRIIYGDKYFWEC